VVAASGPSLTVEQAAIATRAQQDGRCNVIVVNRTVELFPLADCLYAADGKWIRLNIDAIRSQFSGEVWTQDHKAATDLGLHYIKGVPGAGLHADANTIYHGMNSGHQAAGLAKLFGARRILLIGFDMKLGGPNGTGAKHWHPDHQKPLSNGNPVMFRVHFEKLARDLAAAGVECLNASEDTALTVFPRVSLRHALTGVESALSTGHPR